jgi:hypothetical protein
LLRDIRLMQDIILLQLLSFSSPIYSLSFSYVEKNEYLDRSA